jgi:hypothetical protein
MTSRGIRNNNPGNLDFNAAVKWQGQTGLETGVPNPRFAVFSDPKWGIRAIARQLLSYQSQHGIRTVRGLINRWAPPGENNTGAYVAAVAAGVGVDPDAEIDVDTAAVMTPLVKSIILHENGENPYPDSVIAEGVRLAGVADAPPAPLATSKTFQAQVGGAVAVAGAAGAHVASLAPTVKGWADQLGDYAGAPLIQHAVTVLLTVAGGLAVLGIVSQVMKQRAA